MSLRRNPLTIEGAELAPVLREPRRVAASTLRGVTPLSAHAVFPSAKITPTGLTSIGHGPTVGWVKIAFDIATWDNDGMFDNANNRLIAQREGVYHAIGGLAIDNATSTTDCYAAIWKSGVAFAEIGPITPRVTTVTRIIVPVDLDMNVGDYVELYGWQNSGGALNTVAIANMPFLSMKWGAVEK